MLPLSSALTQGQSQEVEGPGGRRPSLRALAGARARKVLATLCASSNQQDSQHRERQVRQPCDGRYRQQVANYQHFREVHAAVVAEDGDGGGDATYHDASAT